MKLNNNSYLKLINNEEHRVLQLIINRNIPLKDTYLYNFYQKFQPKNYGKVFNLKDTNKLSKLPQTSYFYPWLHNKPTNIFRAGLFGPKDITNVEHRVTRLKNLIELIKEKNYIPTEEDIIDGYILVNNLDYRFLIISGHHRVAVLYGLNKKNIVNNNKIIVKFNSKKVKVKIIHRNDSYKWTGVLSKYISEQDSLELFDSFFI